MKSNMNFKRKILIPKEVKEMYPVTPEMEKVIEERSAVIQAILEGKDDRMLLIIGPCSADHEDSVMDYILRLKKISEKVKDKIFVVPRIYTNKPRTTGKGYKGMFHQPDPDKEEDLLKGVVAIRELHIRAIKEAEFICADEMLYPENYRYLSDVLGYVAIGARSVENQQHRLVASGINVAVGMKNPTGGDLNVMMNSITAAQSSHTFLYRGWEVTSSGNPLAHVILRGEVDKYGRNRPNYHYEDIKEVIRLYEERNLLNPAIVVDANHANSGKKFIEQIRISKDVLHSRRMSDDIKKIVKGIMIESYIEDGSQGEHEHEYGKSITDPCLGIEKTEKLIYDLAEMW